MIAVIVLNFKSVSGYMLYLIQDLYFMALYFCE